MACQQENNTVTKQYEKQTKYGQLAFRLKEQRVKYKIHVIPIITGVLGGGIKEPINEVNKIFKEDDFSEKVERCKEQY